MRSAFVQALALLPGAHIDRTSRVFAGHQVYLVEQVQPSGVEGLFVDVTSGRIVGSYAGAPQAQARQSAAEWSYGMVGQPGDTP